MRRFKVSEHLKEVMLKLGRKDKNLYGQILKKIDEILNCADVDHYKNLKYDFKESKRVHMGHFVLIFQYDRNTDTVLFDDFDHHDRIYR